MRTYVMTIAIEREQLGLHVAGDDIGAGHVGDRRRQRGPAQQVGGQVLRSGVPVILGLDLVQAGPEGGVCRGPVSGSRDMIATRIGWCGPAGPAISMRQVPPTRPGSSRSASRVADVMESGGGCQRPS